MKDKTKKYFRPPVFKVLAKELWRRYYLKGNFGSSLGLAHFKDIDTHPLRVFLGISEWEWHKKRTIRVSDFEKSLEQSKFELSPSDFVELLTGNPLITKTAKEQQRKQQVMLFKERLAAISNHFVDDLSDKQLEYWFDKCDGKLSVFRKVAHALNQLPDNFTRMPVFAYQVTGNPHAFDQTEPAGVLLLEVLESMAGDMGKTGDYSRTEKENDLLTHFHLLRDDIMNFVAVSGIVAKDDRGINLMWAEACRRRSSWNVPLKELLAAVSITPYWGNEVLMIENSGIYSIILDKYPEVPIICTNGQFRYAVWVLLRKLAAAGTHFLLRRSRPGGLAHGTAAAGCFPKKCRMSRYDS